VQWQEEGDRIGQRGLQRGMWLLAHLSLGTRVSWPLRPFVASVAPRTKDMAGASATGGRRGEGEGREGGRDLLLSHSKLVRRVEDERDAKVQGASNVCPHLEPHKCKLVSK
jgi:hypothetical protein